jgi:hypothetical protein
MYWARLGCWISPCYDPFSLDARFETYETFIYLTLNLLMSYIYGAPSKARNLTSYIYGRDFLLRIFLLEPCILLIYA